MLRIPVASLVLSLLSLPVAAQPPTKWVDELKNQNGNVCCFDGDGRRLLALEWDTLGKVSRDPIGPSGYRVKDVGETNDWYDAANWSLVTMKNHDGIARVWWDRLYVGGAILKRVKCFIPGSLG